MQGHIRKRGNNYQVIVYLGKDQNGKKKYKYQAAEGQEEAQKILTDLLHSINHNYYTDPGDITFGDYLKEWYDDYCVHKLAPKTLDKYKAIIDKNIIPQIGHIPLIKLQPMNLQKYYSKMLSSGRTGNKNKDQKGLAPSTVLYHHRIIHKALDQAVKWQMITRNIADAVEPPRKQQAKVNVLTLDQLWKLLNVIQENNQVIFMPTFLAAATGMRRAEVLGLKWSDVDFDNGMLNISRQLQRIDGELTTRELKTVKSKRTVKLDDFVVDELKRHKAQQNEVRLSLGKAYKDNYICTWEDGRPVDPDYVTKRFMKIASDNDLNVRFHDLRHSFATLLLSQKVPARIIAEMLGHSSTNITNDIYSHVSVSMQEEAASIVGNAFKKARLSTDCQR